MYINTDKLKIITTLGTAKTITQGKFIVTYPFPLKKRRTEITIQLPSSEKGGGKQRRDGEDQVRTYSLSDSRFSSDGNAAGEASTPPRSADAGAGIAEGGRSPSLPGGRTGGQLKGDDPALPSSAHPRNCPRRPRPRTRWAAARSRRRSSPGPGAAQVLGPLCASSLSLALSRTPSRDSPGGLVPLGRTPPPEDKIPLPPGPAPRSLPQASTPFHLRKEPPPGSLPGLGSRAHLGHPATPLAEGKPTHADWEGKYKGQDRGPETFLSQWDKNGRLQRGHKCTLGGLCVFWEFQVFQGNATLK